MTTAKDGNRRMMTTPSYRCLRCRRVATETVAVAEGWNVRWVSGLVIGQICHECQSPEEVAEGDVHDALSSWSKGRTKKVRISTREAAEAMATYVDEIVDRNLREVIATGIATDVDKITADAMIDLPTFFDGLSDPRGAIRESVRITLDEMRGE